MQVISNQHIIAYTQCPKKLQLGWASYNKIKPTPSEYIIGSVIQTIYLYYTKWNRWPLWKTIILWTERFTTEYFASAEPDYKQTKNYLARISDWYDRYSEKYLIPGLVNVPVSFEINSGLAFRDHMPLVYIKDNFVLADFFEHNGKENYNSMALSNDFKALIKAWGFWKFTRSIPEKFIRFIIKPHIVESVQVSFTEKRLLHIEKIIRYITKGINDSIFYPSISEKCYTCNYKKSCFL